MAYVTKDKGCQHSGLDIANIVTLTNFRKIPVVGALTGQNSIEGQSHNSTVIKKGDDQDHEGREVKLEGKSHDSKTNNNTDGDGTGIDRVVSHTLENNTRLSDGVDDSGKTGFSEHNVSGTTSSVSGTLDGDTDVGTSKSGSVVGTITS
jgi:hypothetical protein